MSMLLPPWVQRCFPWSYYGVLSLAGMDWDAQSRISTMYWRWPEPVDFLLLALWCILFWRIGRTLFVRKEV